MRPLGGFFDVLRAFCSQVSSLETQLFFPVIFRFHIVSPDDLPIHHFPSSRSPNAPRMRASASVVFFFNL